LAFKLCIVLIIPFNQEKTFNNTQGKICLYGPSLQVNVFHLVLPELQVSLNCSDFDPLKIIDKQAKWNRKYTKIYYVFLISSV